MYYISFLSLSPSLAANDFSEFSDRRYNNPNGKMPLINGILHQFVKSIAFSGPKILLL